MPREILYIKQLLDTKKAFRDWTMRRCLEIRAKSEDINTINVCNLLLNYIYDLNWKENQSENNKFRAKGAF